MNSHPNATAAGLSGACVTLGLYIATVLGWDPPPEIAAAIVTIVSAGVLLIPGRKKAPLPPTTVHKKAHAKK